MAKMGRGGDKAWKRLHRACCGREKTCTVPWGRLAGYDLASGQPRASRNRNSGAGSALLSAQVSSWTNVATILWAGGQGHALAVVAGPHRACAVGCLVCLVWARNWRVQGLKAGEFLPNFISFPETPSQREGRRLYLRLGSSLEDPRRLAKAWLVGPDAYQAGQAQIGGLTKGAFSGSDRVGMAAGGPGEGAVGVAACSQAAKQPSQARCEDQAQAPVARCPASRHSVAGGQGDAASMRNGRIRGVFIPCCRPVQNSGTPLLQAGPAAVTLRAAILPFCHAPPPPKKNSRKSPLVLNPISSSPDATRRRLRTWPP